MRPSLGKLALVFTRYANLTLGGGSATATADMVSALKAHLSRC